MSGYGNVASLAVEEMRHRSKKRIYRTDPQAWLSDVLDKRWYSKQVEIAHDFITNPRVAVKSANGCGKSASVADLITWFITVFPPEDSLAIISAPTISQIEKVIFAYLKANYASAKVLAEARGSVMPLVGTISEELTWVYPNPHTGKKEFLAFGKRPTDTDIVSSFQGTRKMVTKVFLDEGGGLPPEIFTAAEAVATGSDSGIITIGNPDRRGTEFHRIFTDDKYKDEWKTSTISAFDLPTFTGEKVYDDPERQAKLLKALTSPEWVEHKRRAWGEGDARWMSKVLGEFPGEADNTFFGQHVIDKAHDTDIEEDLAVRPTLGVDVARWGEDESVIMCKRKGRIRIMDEWGKADTVDSARRIHGHAQSVMAERVQIDASGIGGAVYDMLTTLAEFDDRVYDVVAIDGGYRSPDNARWSNMRAYAHDNLRELMLRGEIDLDYDDKKLRDELIAITYKFNQRGAIQITPKEEMRTAIGGSPDRLDAVIYAALDHTVLLAPEGGIAVIEPEEIPDFGFHDLITSEGWPM